MQIFATISVIVIWAFVFSVFWGSSEMKKQRAEGNPKPSAAGKFTGVLLVVTLVLNNILAILVIAQ